MKRLPIFSAMVIAAALAACDGEGSPDGGGGGLDSGPLPDSGPVSCETDTDCPDTYCNPGSHICCRPTNPAYDLCGDRIDQNCDRHDTSCGDNDRDGVQACRPDQDPVTSGCDCDDERMDVRPAFGALAGAPEACDGIDNDCNGRVDESSQCCDACASLGDARDRADVCTVDGVCDCSTDSGSGPCAEGRTCCAAGCVDLQTDFSNCGFCNAQCTPSADRCVAGNCGCGDGPVCDLVYECVGGACQM